MSFQATYVGKPEMPIQAMFRPNWETVNGMGKKSGASVERSSASKAPAWEVELKAKIGELRRLEKEAFGPWHGRTDSYNYLQAVYKVCDWSDPKVSRRVSRRVAKLYDVKIRTGNLPIRTVIDATCKGGRDVKSRFVQALEYARAKGVSAERFKTFLIEQRGIEACARKMAALRKRKLASKQPQLTRRWGRKND
jgi:hypothetical protein